MTPKPDFLSKSSLKLLKYFFQKGTIIPTETHQLPQGCINQLLDSGFINSSVYQLTSIQCLLNIHIPLPKTGKAIFAI